MCMCMCVCFHVTGRVCTTPEPGALSFLALICQVVLIALLCRLKLTRLARAVATFWANPRLSSVLALYCFVARWLGCLIAWLAGGLDGCPMFFRLKGPRHGRGAGALGPAAAAADQAAPRVAAPGCDHPQGKRRSRASARAKGGMREDVSHTSRGGTCLKQRMFVAWGHIRLNWVVMTHLCGW